MHTPLRHRAYNFWDVTVTGFFEMAWKCWIRRKHHVKMGSYPNCYRCGKRPRHDR